MKGGDFLAKLAAKSGINLADEKYKDFAIAIAAITTDLSDEAVNKMSGALFNMDDARNNIDLKKHFTAAIFDGMDTEINSLMDELGFEVTDKEVVKAEQSTFKKQAALARQIKALEQKKAESTGKDKNELTAKINALTTQLADLPKQHAKEIKELEAKWAEKFTTTQIRGMLNGKKYANDKVPLDVNVETALVLMNRKLESSGAKIVNVNGTLQLKQLKDEQLDWISPSNEKPTIEQFIDSTLAESGMFAVTNNNNAATPPPTGGTGYKPPVVIPGAPPVNQSVLSSLEAQMKQLEAVA